MLKIRDDQLKVFEPVTEADFENRVVEYLRQSRPEAPIELPFKTLSLKEISDEAMRKMIRAGIGRARAYGMTWESSLIGFVVLMFTVAPNFDDEPSIRQALMNSVVAPDHRIDELWDVTGEEDWVSAKQHYTANAWGLTPEDE